MSAIARLGYVIAYVPDVLEAVGFYQRAFGLVVKAIADNKLYAELSGGAAILAFVDEVAAAGETPLFHRNRSTDLPAGIKITFVADDVQAAYDQAVAGGARAVAAPRLRPWGRITAQLRDLNGMLVELCNPESQATRQA